MVFKAYYFDSVIPSQHGIILPSEIPVVPTPDDVAVQAVDVKKADPVAAAMVAGNDTIKKVTERDVSEPGTDLPVAAKVIPPEAKPKGNAVPKKKEEKVVVTKDSNMKNNEEKPPVNKKETLSVKKSEDVQKLATTATSV